MAKFHKHDYHGNVKEKSVKRKKHENQKIPLALSFSHALIIKG
ncbi:hypothetical protein HPPN135_01170 [Helicobacter pylori Puno135]|nr:hypothetical protein HPPN135_01170 [Helicobacter pylori Puno135]